MEGLEDALFQFSSVLAQRDAGALGCGRVPSAELLTRLMLASQANHSIGTDGGSP